MCRGPGLLVTEPGGQRLPSSLKVRSVIWVSDPVFPGTMPASPAFPAAAVVMRELLRALTVSQPPHHLMVFVAQHPRQEKRRLVRASGFEASPRPPFAVNGNVPLTLGARSPLAAAAAAPWWQRLLCGVVTGRVGVVAQLVDPLHKLTLFVENFLGR